jgi:hypothetical protein
MLLSALSSGEPNTHPSYANYWQTLQSASLQSEIETLKRKVAYLEGKLQESALDQSKPVLKETAAAAAPPMQSEEKSDHEADIESFVKICKLAHGSRDIELGQKRPSSEACSALHGRLCGGEETDSATAGGSATALADATLQDFPHSRLYSAVILPVMTTIRSRIEAEQGSAINHSGHRSSKMHIKMLHDIVRVLGVTFCALDLVDKNDDGKTSANANVPSFLNSSTSSKNGSVLPPPGAYTMELLSLLCAFMHDELDGNM